MQAVAMYSNVISTGRDGGIFGLGAHYLSSID